MLCDAKITKWTPIILWILDLQDLSALIIPIALKPRSKPWMVSRLEWSVSKYNWKGQKRPVDPTDDLPFDFLKVQREGLPQVINSITYFLILSISRKIFQSYIGSTSIYSDHWLSKIYLLDQFSFTLFNRPSRSSCTEK